jgi:hypothetical protein
MNALMGLMILASILGIVVGLIMCIPIAKRQSGKLVAGGSFAVFAMCFIAVAIKAPTPASAAAVGRTDSNVAAAQPIQTAAVAPAPRKLTKTDMIGQFRIKGLSWRKVGFNSFMVASFTIHNDNTIPVKDVQITCSSKGFSDTAIDSNTRTIYDVVSQKSFLQVHDMQMGMIRSEVEETKCKVVDFAAA